MAVSLLIASRVSHVASSRQQKEQFLGNCISQRSTEDEVWLNEKSQHSNESEFKSEIEEYFDWILSFSY
jgi:hypothetical protein